MEDPSTSTNYVNAAALKRYNFFKGMVPVLLLALLLSFISRPQATETTPTAVDDNRTVEVGELVLNRPQVSNPRPAANGLTTASVQVSGQGRPQTEVLLAMGDTVMGTAVPDEAGNWQFMGDVSLPPGTYELEARMVATDGTELSQATQTGIIVPEVDEEGMAVAITEIDADPSLGFAIVIRGIAPPNGDVELIVNDVVLDSVRADENGNWDYLPLIPPAEYFLSVRAAGKENPVSEPMLLVVERIVAIREVITNQDDTTGATINGTALPNTNIEVLVDDEVVTTVTTDDQGNWTYTTPLAVGVHEIMARLANSPAQISDPSRFIVEALITINPIEGDQSAQGRSGAAATGTAPPNSTVEILLNGDVIDTIVANPNGTWLYPLPSTLSGEYEMQVRVADNTSLISEPQTFVSNRSISLDEVASVETASLDGVVLSGQAPANTEVEIVLSGEVIGTTRADSSGSWTFTSAPLSVDSYELQARLVQNSNQTSESYPLVVSPFVSSNVPEVVALNDSESEVTLRGRATVGVPINIVASGTTIETITADDSGTWVYTFLLANGIYDIIAQVTAPDSVTVLAETRFPTVSVGQPGGLLQVVFAGTVTNPTDSTKTNNAAAVAPMGSPVVELIVDASWSMTQPLGEGTRFDVARDTIQNIIDNVLPSGTPFALRAFGNIEGNFNCRTDLMLPYQLLDREAFSAVLADMAPQVDANTPIAASLAEVTNDLAAAQEDRAIVVLLTDGEETCDGSPATEIQRLVEAGFEVQVNIVGLAIADDALKAEFERWATLGNGQYFDATNPEALATALSEALLLTYSVISNDGRTITTGRVGGLPVTLAPGEYIIRINTSVAPIFPVTILEGETEQLTIQ